MSTGACGNITLCHPGGHKTCFACCPPIRPKGYEHIQYRNIISRILRENTSNYPKIKKDILPITGFSCWALGYLDSNYKTVGCLLHPEQNHGIDLRYRIDYGEKCSRETCWESKIFGKLSLGARVALLALCDGMDSFEYSSRKYNPLFNLLGWGNELLEELVLVEGTEFSRNDFFQKYPFFNASIAPRPHAYLAFGLIRKYGINLLKDPAFILPFKKHCKHLKEQFSHKIGVNDAPGTYTHLLDMDPKFLDFLRLGLGIRKITYHLATQLKQEVDRSLEEIFI